MVNKFTCKNSQGGGKEKEPIIVLLNFRTRKELDEVKKKSESYPEGGGDSSSMSAMEQYMRRNQFHSPVPGTIDYVSAKQALHNGR